MQTLYQTMQAFLRGSLPKADAIKKLMAHGICFSDAERMLEKALDDELKALFEDIPDADENDLRDPT